YGRSRTDSPPRWLQDQSVCERFQNPRRPNHNTARNDAPILGHWRSTARVSKRLPRRGSRLLKRGTAPIFEGEFEMPKSMLGFSLALVILPFAACGKPAGSQAQTSSSPTTQTPTVIVTAVRSLELNRQIRLPGELQAWQDTAIYAKVQGFV